MTDKTVYIAVTPAMRRLLAAMAENLVEMLDQLDGDENMEEPGDLEPSLGWPLGHGLSQLDLRIAHDDDREMENEHGGDITDEAQDDNELEEDHAELDSPGLIWGGQGL